jgi:hypothetical protein
LATHQSLLYDLTIEDDGHVRMGIDTETGVPIRGGGKGFEQDILLYETPDSSDAFPVVPRVVAEVKFNRVTTHDTIVYSEKARRIRTVYPYVRYGLILGDFKTIPGRVLRLGQGFDFIVTLSYPFVVDEIASTRVVFLEELQSSRDLGRIAYGKRCVSALRRRICLVEPSTADGNRR